MRMLKYTSTVALLIAAEAGLAAVNLVPNGDFSRSSQTLAPDCRAEAGRVSLHVEDLTWNRCGKCEVSGGVPDREYVGCTVYAANALIGFAAAERGFTVKPGCRYDVSFDLKSLAGEMGVSADVVCWTGDSYWKDRKIVKSVVPGGVKATADWRTFKGSFKAPEGSVRAALRLAVWSSTKWKDRRQYAVGDAFLFDNVCIAVAKRNLEAVADNVPPVALRKTVAVGDSFDDLVSFKDGKTPATVRTRFCVRKDGDALRFDIVAEEPGGVAAGAPDKPWSGDTIEIQVEGCDGAKRTHVAFNNAGAKYSSAGAGGSNGDWSVAVECGETSWTACARLPFRFLGLKEPLEEIGFNVGRARAKAKTFDCWSPGASFHDPSCFGRLLFNGYSSALEKEFGGTFAVSSRADFDAAWAVCAEKRLAEKIARFKDAKVSVAPVSKMSDWTQPFLPEEIFDPPSNIVLKAAINEVAALPLAIANLSGRVEDYRVVLDVEGGPIAGGFGLRGFPVTKISMRRGVRVRDVEGPSPSTRFDPLVRMDEVGTLTGPPREAGLVWCDFDCTGVKPGVYDGYLRVTPLCEEGRLSGTGPNLKYAGKMQRIPVSLEVVDAEIPARSAVPAQYFMAAPSEEVLDVAFEIGAEAFQIHSWAFAFERDAAGNLDLNRPKKGALDVAMTVSNHTAWAAKHGFRPKFVIVYSAMDACEGLYGCAKDHEKFRRIWPQYVRGLKKIMNGAGVADDDYAVEVKDEPKPAVLGRVLEAHKIAKATCPTVRLMMLLASWQPTVAQMREFMPYADVWDLWSTAYFKSEAYRSFVRELKAAGQMVRSYSCETSIRVPLLQYYRHHAWRAEYHGLDGIDMYQLFDHIHGKGFGRKDFIVSPRGGVIYGSYGAPVPSLRYMALREGFTDCKMLAALRKANAVAKDPEATAFLTSAAAEVVEQHANDPALPDRLRDRAREWLARLAGGETR